METKVECLYQYSCGGCDLLHLSYFDQLKNKDIETIRTFESSSLPTDRIRSIIPAKKITSYRNKMQYNFDVTYEGEIICGNYAMNSHHLVSIDRCLLESELSYKIKKEFLHLMRKYSISPYSNSIPNGTVKHLVIRNNWDSSQAMVIIVTKTSFLPKVKTLVSRLTSKFPQIKSIVHIHNNRNSGNILNGEEKLIFGKNYITDKLSGYTYHISAKSFFQINSDQTEILYNRAIDMTKLKKDDLLLDAYCGIGTIGITASKLISRVMGIEIVYEAVENARDNAERNKIDNIQYKAGDISKVIERISDFVPTVVMVDPPRGGLSKKFLGYLNYNKPAKITYISCNQKTLVKDLKMLIKNYDIEIVQPIDMFPLTSNIETIVVLKLK